MENKINTILGGIAVVLFIVVAGLIGYIVLRSSVEDTPEQASAPVQNQTADTSVLTNPTEPSEAGPGVQSIAVQDCISTPFTVTQGSVVLLNNNLEEPMTIYDLSFEAVRDQKSPEINPGEPYRKVFDQTGSFFFMVQPLDQRCQFEVIPFESALTQ